MQIEKIIDINEFHDVVDLQLLKFREYRKYQNTEIDIKIVENILEHLYKIKDLTQLLILDIDINKKLYSHYINEDVYSKYKEPNKEK